MFPAPESHSFINKRSYIIQGLASGSVCGFIPVPSTAVLAFPLGQSYAEFLLD